MKKIIFDKTFYRFIIVGVINTLFGTAIMFCCYNLFHFSYWVSSAANYFFGSILSFILNKKFTFRDPVKGWKPVLKFTVNIICCYLLAYGLAKPIIYRLLSGFSVTIRDNGAMLTGMVFFVLLNYFGQRFFVFKPSENSDNDNIC